MNTETEMGREGERGREREMEGDRERQGQTDRAPKLHRVPLLPRLCWAVPLPGTPRAPPHPPGPMPLRPHRALCLGPSAAALSLPAQHPPLWLSLCPGWGRGLASVPGSLAASSPAVSTVSGPGWDSCTHHPGPKPSHPRGAGWLALPLLLSPPCTRTLLPGAQSGLGSLGPWSGGPYLLGSSCSRAQPDPFWL